MESVILTITTICCLIRLLQLAMYGMTVPKLQDKCRSKLRLMPTIKSIVMSIHI